MKKTAKSTYFIEEYKTDVPENMDRWKVAFPPKVVKKLIKYYSKKGNVIFDPFAGFGTTLGVGKKLNRIVFGTEIEKERINFAKKQYAINLIEESVFKLDLKKYPKIVLCIFSPPYWGPCLQVKTYKRYIVKLKNLVKKIKARMNKGGYLIVLIQNYQTKNGQLTQAWDLGNTLKEFLFFEQDIIWCIDRSKIKRDMQCEAADHHYCLVFKKQ